MELYPIVHGMDIAYALVRAYTYYLCKQTTQINGCEFASNGK